MSNNHWLAEPLVQLGCEAQGVTMKCGVEDHGNLTFSLDGSSFLEERLTIEAVNILQPLL